MDRLREPSGPVEPWGPVGPMQQQHDVQQKFLSDIVISNCAVKFARFGS